MGMTREHFDQLGVLEQGSIKWKFIQAHFAEFVNNIQAGNILQDLAAVLHRNDMEQIEKDMCNKGNNMVMSGLLLKLRRTCKPWWKPLEKYLLDNEEYELLTYLNPWTDSEDFGASAASPKGPQGNADRTSGCVQPPYSSCTPLGKTRGLVDKLKSCSWGHLAEKLGFDLGEQVDIETKAACREELHRCLVTAYIKKYRDNATVGSLVKALLQMGSEGRQIVSAMEEDQVIVHYEREGSEAGEPRAEECCGYNFNERGDEASARSPPVHPLSGNSACRPCSTSANSIPPSLPLNLLSSNQTPSPCGAEHAGAAELPVPSSQQESPRALCAYGTEQRQTSSPRETHPLQINSDGENFTGFPLHQNSEPGRFADSETQPDNMHECDSLHSLCDNASQPEQYDHAGETKQLNNAAREGDLAECWQDETDDQEDGESFIQTDGPSEIFPASSSCSQLAEGQDEISSSAAAFYSQPSTSWMPSAAELGISPLGNSSPSITVNLHLHNSKSSVVMIGQTNKIHQKSKNRSSSSQIPVLEQAGETGDDRQQETTVTLGTPSPPVEQDFERSDIGLCQPGSSGSPAGSASAGQSFARDEEPLPWEWSRHQTDRKEVIQSETEAAPRLTAGMDLPDSSDIDFMSSRGFMSEDPWEQRSCHSGDSDDDSSLPRMSGSELEVNDKSLCSQGEDMEGQEEEPNRDNTEEREKKEATPVAPVGDQQREKQQEQCQQPSGLWRKFSDFVRNVIDSVE